MNLGDDGNVQTTGFLNSVLNIFGNRNSLAASGVFNNATNFFGDDNSLAASNVPDPTANILRQIGGNVAFNLFGSRNNLTAGSQIAPPPGGPLSIVGAIEANGQTVDQPGTGITIKTPFNADSNPPVLAARGTQGVVRPSLNATVNRPKAAQESLSRTSLNATLDDQPKATSASRPALKAAGDRIATSVKKVKDAVSRGTGGSADAASKQAEAKSGDSEK